MFEFAYNEIIEESAHAMRAQERMALDHVINLLRGAAAKGPKSVEGINALYQLRMLWTVFLDDLKNPENALPASLAGAPDLDRDLGEQGNRSAAERDRERPDPADRDQRNHTRWTELRGS